VERSSHQQSHLVECLGRHDLRVEFQNRRCQHSISSSSSANNGLVAAAVSTGKSSVKYTSVPRCSEPKWPSRGLLCSGVPGPGAAVLTSSVAPRFLSGENWATRLASLATRLASLLPLAAAWRARSAVTGQKVMFISFSWAFLSSFSSSVLVSVVSGLLVPSIGGLLEAGQLPFSANGGNLGTHEGGVLAQGAAFVVIIMVNLWAWLGLLLFSSSILRQLQLPPSSAVVCWFSSTCCLASALRLPQRRAASRRRWLRFMEHAAVLAEWFVALADLLLRSQPPPQGYSLTMLYPWVVRCRRIGVEASGRGRAVPQGRL